jgi:AraC family transcriptional regulator
VQIGAFRCPIGHPTFADSGPIRSHCFVFPRTPVLIRHRDQPPFAADPTLATLYNKGQEYGRAAVSPDGDLCDWYAIAPALLHDALASFDPRAADDNRRPIRFAFTRVDASTYLHQRRLFTRAARAPGLDALQIDESVIELLDRVLTFAYGGGSAASKCTPSLLVHDVCELLGRHFAEPLTLAEIARAVGASVFHLCRTFRRATGTTIHAYRTQLRLRSALDRLENADCDLSQLALDLGFSSHSHFTASFRTAFGVPPSTARRHVCATS